LHDSRDLWDQAESLKVWLDAHAGESVNLICSEYASGRMRYVLDHVLSPSSAHAVRVVPWFTENQRDWWLSRRGVKDVLYSAVDLAFVAFWREGRTAGRSLSVNQYQQQVDAMIGEAAR